MASPAPQVSVIVPTTAEPRRRESLLRALASISGQEGVRALPIVVINGGAYSRELYASIESDPGMRLVYHAAPSLPNAIMAGRAAVETEFFAYLDDDDVYLPDALRIRLGAMTADPSIDVVVTNGYWVRGGNRGLQSETFLQNASDPLMALADGNWLASCGGLFRTATVSAACFRHLTPYCEWTDLASRIAEQCRIRFLDVPTFQVNESESSLSKRPEYVQGQLHVIERILERPLARPLRERFALKLQDALHNMAERYAGEGKRRAAWAYHWRSLRVGRPLRYLLYTRKLLLPRARWLSGGKG